MAAVYVVDAIFYFLAWLVSELEKRDHEGKVIVYDAAAWGELLYVFSAIFGLAAAGCGFLVPVDGDNQIAEVASSLTALFAYAAMLWISNTLYLVDSVVSSQCRTCPLFRCSPQTGLLERVVQQVRDDCAGGQGACLL